MFICLKKGETISSLLKRSTNVCNQENLEPEDNCCNIRCKKYDHSTIKKKKPKDLDVLSIPSQKESACEKLPCEIKVTFAKRWIINH